MREYETVVVFDGSLSQSALDAGTANIKKVLSSCGASGEIVVDDWGRREMPHPAGKNVAGRFLAFRYQSETGDVVNSANTTLRITDGILKFQSHRLATTQRKFHGNPRLLKEK